MAVPIFLKRGISLTAPDPISIAYVINPFHCMCKGWASSALAPRPTVVYCASIPSISLCVSICIPAIAARQRLGKADPFYVARQRFCKYVSAATNTRNNRRVVGRMSLWVCLCTPFLLLGNGSVKTLPQRGRHF
jgi:hypothetical protein